MSIVGNSCRFTGPAIAAAAALTSPSRSMRELEEPARLVGVAHVSINGWNRLNIAARTVPGDYVPGMFTKVHAAS